MGSTLLEPFAPCDSPVSQLRELLGGLLGRRLRRVEASFEGAEALGEVVPGQEQAVGHHAGALPQRI